MRFDANEFYCPVCGVDVKDDIVSEAEKLVGILVENTIVEFPCPDCDITLAYDVDVRWEYWVTSASLVTQVEQQPA